MRGSFIKGAKQRPVKAVTGALAATLLLAGTRWGSYVGVAPIFLTDVLILLAVFDALIGITAFGPRSAGSITRSRPPLVVGLFLLYVLLRGALSADYAFTVTWVRDLAPFLYLGIAFVSAWSMGSADTKAKEKTMQFLWAGLIFHLVWTAVVVLGKLPETRFPQLPLSGVHALSIRPDIDMAILSVTAGLLLRRLMLRKTKIWGILGLLLAVVTASALHSRAGLISLTLALAASYVMTFAMTPKESRKRVAMILAVPLLLAVGVAGAAQTKPGERMIATVLNTHTGTENELNAQGTERARDLTWTGVIEWTLSEPSRALVGSGFGNDFLKESGVLSYLEGTTYDNVRSPHNWLVGVFARMGMVGVALAFAVLATLVALIWRNRAGSGADELLCLASLIVLAIIPVAMLGVVLEAPFGAIPFWWAAGIVFSVGQAGHKEAKERSRPATQSLGIR